MNLAEQYARITQMMVASQAEFCARNELIEARYLAAIRGETLPEDTPENEEPDENDKSNAGTPAAGDGASPD